MREPLPRAGVAPSQPHLPGDGARGADDTDRFVSTTPRLDGTPTAAPRDAVRGNLPEKLLDGVNARVRHGDDPGDFYCEHAFFTAQQSASAAGSSVVANAHGERLVGFLHVPRDEQTGSPDAVPDQAARHAGTREVVGAALRGYVDEAHKQGASPTRVLLTGYEAWGPVQNNPTGDFVSHRDNVDAAMRKAFGNRLVDATGKRVDGDEHHDVWSYRVRDQHGKTREVQIDARRLPVDDDAINGSSRSLQSAISSFRPHGVISMGVHGGSDYLAEHHADDGGLGVDDTGRQRHTEGSTPSTNLADNYALPRAIHDGGKPKPVRTHGLGRNTSDFSVHAVAARRQTPRS